MSKGILVAGITNMETTVRLEGFPLEYTKSRFAFDGVTDRVGGVGYNVARMLAAMGARVELFTLLGRDLVGNVLREKLATIIGLGQRCIQQTEAQTLRSTILVDPTGRGAMFTDLKNSQDLVLPEDVLNESLAGVEWVHASNINWALSVAQDAKGKGITVSTDVQNLRQLDDAYNSRFLAVADWVFLSGEQVEGSQKDFLEQLMARYAVSGVVMTVAENGAFLGTRKADGNLQVQHQKAILQGPVVNVTGAGDTLAAGFMAGMQQGLSPWESLLMGQVAAGFRITQPSSSDGTPDAVWLKEECKKRLHQ
jgi:sugar/nucleoside kinase (ribokinase family)